MTFLCKNEQLRSDKSLQKDQYSSLFDIKATLKMLDAPESWIIQ